MLLIGSAVSLVSFFFFLHISWFIFTLGVYLFPVQGEILLGENGIHLASTNIVASNGIIHMIDGILYPPSILPILPHRCDVTESKIIVVRGGRLRVKSNSEQTNRRKQEQTQIFN